MQHSLIQQRTFLKLFQNRLQLALIALRQLQNDALTAFVRASEGHADAKPNRKRHPIGDTVVIGLVDGIDRSGNGNFRDHRPPSLVLRKITP